MKKNKKVKILVAALALTMMLTPSGIFATQSSEEGSTSSKSSTSTKQSETERTESSSASSSDMNTDSDSSDREQSQSGSGSSSTDTEQSESDRDGTEDEGVTTTAASTSESAKSEDSQLNCAVSTYDSMGKAPSISAEGAMVMIGGTNQVLYAKNIDEHLDPLSTTKLMTVYLTMKAIDQGKITLDTEFTTTKADTKVEESKLYLRKGEKTKVRNLLYATLLESANDAAATLGSNLAGNKDKFAKEMNKAAKELGCTDTKFTNANGLIENGNYSSAHDIMLIAQKCFQYEFVQKVCQTWTYKIPPTNMYDSSVKLITTNPFWVDDNDNLKSNKPYKKYNILAGKTGTWDANNAALVEMAEYNGKYIYTVVLNDKLTKRYSDTVKLIEYAQNAIDSQEALEKAEKEEMEAAKGNQGGVLAKAIEKTRSYKSFVKKINKISKANSAKIKTASYDAEDGVKITWDAVEDAEGYEVYRASGSKYEKVAEKSKDSKKSYVDKDVKTNKIYHYYVKAKRNSLLEFFLAK